jgi:hypothetical protein
MPDNSKFRRATGITALGGAAAFLLVAGGFLLDTFDVLPVAWKPVALAVIGVALVAVAAAIVIVLDAPKSN